MNVTTTYAGFVEIIPVLGGPIYSILPGESWGPSRALSFVDGKDRLESFSLRKEGEAERIVGGWTLPVAATSVEAEGHYELVVGPYYRWRQAGE